MTHRFSTYIRGAYRKQDPILTDLFTPTMLVARMESPLRRTESKMSTRVPLLDLRAQFELIRDPIFEAIARVVESQQFILGPEVEALEREIAAYCDTRFAIGCSSG